LLTLCFRTFWCETFSATNGSSLGCSAPILKSTICEKAKGESARGMLNFGLPVYAPRTSLISLAMKVVWFPIVQPHAMQIAFGPITWNTLGNPGCVMRQGSLSARPP